MEPSFLLSYWRPWNENSSFIDSWGDYLRDRSMVEYGADRVGSYIKDATREQVGAIRNAAEKQSIDIANSARYQARVMQSIGDAQVAAIKNAAKLIGSQLDANKEELGFLNRRMDIAIEQNRVGLLLQKDIAELLKISSSEKERQQAITLGMQFFFNASKDSDLYDDALEEFLRAETMKKQDYFVLHRIGCIYLYVEKHLDIQKSRDYFVRAGKYASVESDPDAVRLVNIITNNINDTYTKSTSDVQTIQMLAADSYEKAALASYILGEDDKAVLYQGKALSLNNSAENLFKFGKYSLRNGSSSDALVQLDKAISKKPEIMEAILCDADTASDSQVMDFVRGKVDEVNVALEDALDIVLANNANDKRLVRGLYDGGSIPYAERVHLVEKAIGRELNME